MTRQSLIDRFMPSWRLRDVRHIAVVAPPEATWRATRTVDRSHIARVGSPLATRLIPDRILAEEPGREIVFGAAGTLWHPSLDILRIEPEIFADFEAPRSVKVVWGLTVAPRTGGTWLTIDLRAVTADARTLVRYRPYWRFASAFSRAVGAAFAEELGRGAGDARAPLGGDELLPAARAQATHSIDIEAPPAQVWPWLVQMGRHRGGWYSWDLLDNGGARSADRIVPALQELAVGDVLPIKATGPDGFTVIMLDPPCTMVLGDASLLPGRSKPARGAARATWAFSLEPIGESATHLVVRVRVEYERSPLATLLRPVVVGVHDVMERKQLRTLKQRAEAR